MTEIKAKKSFIKLSATLADMIVLAIRKGLTNEQVVKQCGVTITNFYNWRRKGKKDIEQGNFTLYSIFESQVQLAKQRRVEEVENHLYQSAIGGRKLRETTKVRNYERNVDGDLVEVAAKTTSIEKEASPSVTAQIFFLKNRDPKNWRDAHVVDKNINISMVVPDSPELSADDWFQKYGVKGQLQDEPDLLEQESDNDEEEYDNDDITMPDSESNSE